VNSYGDVQQFFLHNSCRSLDRMLFLLADGDGNSIVVSVSWVEMRSTSAARKLRELTDVDGTGNVRPLPSELIGTDDIAWTGLNYDSRRSGRLVVIAEVEPQRGDPDAEFMDGIADVAAEFPRP
jgi:hypothetical protein